MSYTIRKTPNKEEYCVFAKDGARKGCRKSRASAGQLRKQILRAWAAQKHEHSESPIGEEQKPYATLCLALELPEHMANWCDEMQAQLGLKPRNWAPHCTLIYLELTNIQQLGEAIAYAYSATELISSAIGDIELSFGNWQLLGDDALVLLIADYSGALFLLQSALTDMLSQFGLEHSNALAKHGSYLPHSTIGHIADEMPINEISRCYVSQEPFVCSDWLISLKLDEGYSFGEKSVKAPAYLADVAIKALRARSNKGSVSAGTRVGIERAHQLARREKLSLSTLKRMKSYISRAAGQLSAKSGDTVHNNRAMQALALWGASPGNKDRVLKWLDSAIAKLEAN